MGRTKLPEAPGVHPPANEERCGWVEAHRTVLAEAFGLSQAHVSRQSVFAKLGRFHGRCGKPNFARYCYSSVLLIAATMATVVVMAAEHFAVQHSLQEVSRSVPTWEAQQKQHRFFHPSKCLRIWVSMPGNRPVAQRKAWGKSQLMTSEMALKLMIK